MESLYFEDIRELRREKAALEQKLGVTITIYGKKAVIEGDSINEYDALHVLEAIQFGFSAKEALRLTEEDMIFRKIPIKQFTRRKNMYDVRARIIGKDGKTRRTVENISGCDVIISDSHVGVIGLAENIETATTAITNLIKGSKEANVYHFLERSNTLRKQQRSDLGLKTKDDKPNKKNKQMDDEEADQEYEEDSEE